MIPRHLIRAGLSVYLWGFREGDVFIHIRRADFADPCVKSPADSVETHVRGVEINGDSGDAPAERGEIHRGRGEIHGESAEIQAIAGRATALAGRSPVTAAAPPVSAARSTSTTWRPTVTAGKPTQRSRITPSIAYNPFEIKNL